MKREVKKRLLAIWAVLRGKPVMYRMKVNHHGSTTAVSVNANGTIIMDCVITTHYPAAKYDGVLPTFPALKAGDAT